MINLTSSREAAGVGVTAVPNALILSLLRDAPGEFVKVYVFALMQAQNPALYNEDIHLALGMSEEEVIGAFDYWARRGVLRIISGEGSTHIEFLPVSSSASLFAPRDSEYESLLAALREVLGTRVFSTSELRVVYDWIEVFGLPRDVVIKLVAYCIDAKGRSVSVRYMDQVAKTWADKHMYSVEDVDRYLQEQNEYMGKVREIKKRWRLSRSITEDELALYKKWSTQWQLPHEVIMDACADAVHASSPSFAYLDSVLSAYMERGTADMAAIEAFRKKRMESDDLARRMFEKAGLKRKPTLLQRDRVDTWLNDWRLPEEALLLLSERAAGVSKPFEFMARIAASWNERDIRNTEAAKDDLNTTDNTPRSRRSYTPKQTRRRYSMEDLERMGVTSNDGTRNEEE